MRLLFTGNIDNIAYSCAKFSRWLGFDADVLVSSVEQDISHPFWEDGEEVAAPITRNFERRKGLLLPLSLLDLRRVFKEYDVVVAMGLMSIPAHFLAPSYVSIALGADMKELVFEKSLKGRLMDRAFRGANVLFYNDVDHLPAVAEKGYDQALYFPVPIDTEKYRPDDRARSNGEMLLIHGSSLSWSLDWTQDKELHRRTLKRNDLFFEALKIFLDANSGFPLKVVVPLWGPDKDKVAPLCEKLGIRSAVKLVPKVTKGELLDLYHRADVVVDQFNMPRLGYNAFEAMACGRPVLGYFSEALQGQLYAELPPMSSAGSAAEIALCLEDLATPQSRERMGAAARTWVVKYHHWKPVMENLLSHCETARMRA